MELYRDLLEQARHLATKEPRRPKQASLRRAVSSAYYSLFHLLINEATSRLVTGRGRTEIRAGLARGFQHSVMRAVATETAKPSWGKLHSLKSIPIPAELYTVAAAFVDLQEARHEADYSVVATLSRSDTLAIINQTDQAVKAWNRIRGSVAADAFLTALIAYDGMRRG